MGHPNKTVRNVFKLVLEEVKEVWEKTVTPIKKDLNVLNRLVSILEKDIVTYKKFTIRFELKTKKGVSQQAKSFTKHLDTVFDMSIFGCYLQLSFRQS